MPGLSLTMAQAARLWNLDVGTARTALHLLVEASFLAETENGQYVVAQRPGATRSR